MGSGGARAQRMTLVQVLADCAARGPTARISPRGQPSFIFANGFLLLTVVFLPFPTATEESIDQG